MTTLTMQKRIISKLKETKDKNLLNDIYNLLNLSQEADMIISLSQKQKAEVRIGLQDIKEGRTMTNLKAKRDTEKWLSK